MAGFGEKLKRERARAGLSQSQLAEAAGLSKGGICDLEAGRRQPAWDTVQRLAAALGVDCTAFADAAGKTISRPKKRKT
jgi:transcriptional regulator with XRE-family HTH domain